MPQIISPAQALLILMDKYKDNPLLSAKFKTWYLNGIDTSEHPEFQSYCLDLKDYELDFNSDSIDKDPSKRYFETHLAHATLQHHLHDLNLEQLTFLISLLQEKIDESMALIPPISQSRHQELMQNVLKGEPHDEYGNLYNEYAILIQRIQTKSLLPELGDKEREKMLLMAKITFLVTLSTIYNNQTFPLNIYGKDIYAEESRGKKLKPTDEYSQQLNPAMGLMKSYMPLARDDLAFSEPTIPLFRAPDQSFFTLKASWVKHNFSLLVHPFSNSISGTILCLLRNFLYFAQRDQFPFMNSREEFKTFIKIFVSTLLYGLGGHSLYEFLAPFNHPQIKSAFRFVVGEEPFDIEHLFLQDNEAAFEEALVNTQTYHRLLLNKASLYARIKEPMSAFQAQQKEDLTTVIQELDTHYQTKISHQMFFRYRNLSDKQKLIHSACQAGLTALTANHLDESARIIGQLKQDFERIYGQGLGCSRISRGWMMINEADKKITEILNRSFKFLSPK